MTMTLTVRLDEHTEHELAELTEHATSRNAAIVAAIHESYRHAAYERMRRESEALRDDPEYLAEVKAIREDTGADNAW